MKIDIKKLAEEIAADKKPRQMSLVRALTKEPTPLRGRLLKTKVIVN